jgi:signal transduction histidine kinase
LVLVNISTVLSWSVPHKLNVGRRSVGATKLQFRKITWFYASWLSGRKNASTLEDLRAVADQAIAGLDHFLTIITGLLRIAEIEHSRRLERFSEVRLGPLLREVGDLYEPIAEDKRVAFRLEAADEATVHGDRDLFFEAVVNLVDNAVKFTPEGGCVNLALLRRDGETVIRVSDTGPGIPETEREAVTKRFYRSDKSRSTVALGLA